MARAFVAIALLLIGCRPELKPPPEEPRVWSISPLTLLNSYEDHSDRWTGQRIRIILEPKTYTIAPTSITWHKNRVGFPPRIIFLCSPPPDNSVALTVEGTCRGAYRNAANQITVQLADCTVTASPP